MISLANPTMLWLLTGLSIPLAIHLLSRKEGKVIRIGSIRHLSETPTSKFRSLKLNEILLLTLRSALITFIVMLLAGLSVNYNSISSRERWLVIEKGVEQRPQTQEVIDSLISNNYTLHFLSDDFPTEAEEATELPDYRKLCEELEQMNKEVIVFSFSKLDLFIGRATILDNNIKWITVPSPTKKITIAESKMPDGKTWSRTGIFSDSLTLFENQMSESPANGSGADTIHIDLIANKVYEEEKKIITAAIRSIQTQTPQILNLHEIDNSAERKKGGFLITLEETKIDADKVIDLKLSQDADLLIQDSKTKWSITKRLNQEIAVENNFTAHLMEIFLADKRIQKKVSRNDQRSLETKMAWSIPKSDMRFTKNSTTHANMNSILLILITLTIITERIIAYRKAQ